MGETSIQAAALQHRDSIGGWLHHLRRCVAVRSDAWVMVMLLHLSGLYSTKRMVSPNFRSLIFYIMHHLARNYKEMFGIYVNTQTVVTFLDIGKCTTFLRMYRLRIIHTLRRYNDSSGSMILVHIIVVLQSGTTFSCCLLPW